MKLSARLSHIIFSFIITLILINFQSCQNQDSVQGYSTNTDVLENGNRLFSQQCASCHGLESSIIGPRLGGITKLLSKDALIAFINNPEKVINLGNKRAVRQFAEYKTLMPAYGMLNQDDIISILSYIDERSTALELEPLKLKALDRGKNDVLVDPIKKSSIEIEIKDYAKIPASADDKLVTRIATMRPNPNKDGSQFVSDIRGMIYMITEGKVDTFLNIRKFIPEFIDAPGMGTGLGSFVFHPDYMQNGLIYITHAESNLAKKATYPYADSIKINFQWVLSEWKIDNVDQKVFKGEHRELLRVNVPSGIHGFQDLGFATEKDKPYLFLGIGDGGSTINGFPELCHTKESLLGTIIRIDPAGNNSKNGQYGIPETNPFSASNNKNVKKEIWAYGFRNPHRMAWEFDDHGRMFVTGIGERNIEELNVITKGGDYGWNVREGSFGISTDDLPAVYEVANNNEFIDPYGQYDHSEGRAISGGFNYKGNIEALNNKYFFGDVVSGRLFFMNIDATLSDSTIYEVSIIHDGKSVDLPALAKATRADLRIGYDNFKHEMYIFTKRDGMVRKVIAAKEK